MDENLALAVNQWINGNEEGFNTIYNETYNYVFAKTRAIMKNYDDAADLLQEVYIAASKSLSTLSDPNNLYAWLGGIAYRQGMKIFNKQRDVLVSDEGEGLFEVQECLDKSVQPGVEMEERETADIIKDMLDELPPEQSAVVVAYYYDEMSVTDIAETLGVSTGTIKSRLNYARKKLQELVIAKEEREGIRLHSVTIPTIIIAVRMYMEGFSLGIADAQIAYNSIATKMQYVSVVAQSFDNVSNAGYLASSASNPGAVSGVSNGVTGMSVTATSVSVSSTVGTSIIKSIAVMIIIIISTSVGAVIGSNIYQKYSDDLSSESDSSYSSNESFEEPSGSGKEDVSSDSVSENASSESDTKSSESIYEDELSTLLENASDNEWAKQDEIEHDSPAGYFVVPMHDVQTMYAYYDFNNDDVDELVIGARACVDYEDYDNCYSTFSAGIVDIYGIYTVFDGVLKTVFEYDGNLDFRIDMLSEDGYVIRKYDDDGEFVQIDRIIADGEIENITTKQVDYINNDSIEVEPAHVEWRTSEGVVIPYTRKGYIISNWLVEKKPSGRAKDFIGSGYMKAKVSNDTVVLSGEKLGPLEKNKISLKVDENCIFTEKPIYNKVFYKESNIYSVLKACKSKGVYNYVTLYVDENETIYRVESICISL